MLITKKVNNNVAIARDEDGRELVVFGKGVGFGEMPHELADPSVIQRVYHHVNDDLLQSVASISSEAVGIALDIVKAAELELDCTLNANLYLTLADHLQFAIERLTQGIVMEHLLEGEIPYVFQREYAIGQRALEIVRREAGISFPDSEACAIALHIANAETDGGVFNASMTTVMVIFGLHWACVPIVLTNLAVLGFDAVLSGREVCTFAQTAATMAIFFKTKDQKLKQIALPAAIIGFFGTTEPCIYGVTLPKKKPFVISCIASAIGGGFVGLMGVKKFTSGFSGILGLPIFVDPSGAEGITNVIWLGVGIIITMVIAFVGTWATYRDEEKAAA